MDKKEENLRLLLRYIKEAIDLGNVQFSPNRLDKVDKTEPNTREEEILYRNLINRVVGEKQIDAATAKDLKDLINSKKYGAAGSGFFSGPADPVMLYRGQLYPQQWAEDNISNFRAIPKWDGRYDQFTQIFSKMTPFPLNPPYIYGPNKNEGFRGWTPDFSVACRFAMSYWEEDRGPVTRGGRYKAYAVILTLDPSRNPPDSLLDFSRNVYKTGMGRGYKHEKEILNIDSVQCHTAYVLECPTPSPYDL